MNDLMVNNCVRIKLAIVLVVSVLCVFNSSGQALGKAEDPKVIVNYQDEDGRMVYKIYSSHIDLAYNYTDQKKKQSSIEHRVKLTEKNIRLLEKVLSKITLDGLSESYHNDISGGPTLLFLFHPETEKEKKILVANRRVKPLQSLVDVIDDIVPYRFRTDYSAHLEFVERNLEGSGMEADFTVDK